MVFQNGQRIDHGQRIVTRVAQVLGAEPVSLEFMFPAETAEAGPGPD